MKLEATIRPPRRTGSAVFFFCTLYLIVIGGCGDDDDGSTSRRDVPLYNQWEITSTAPLLDPDGTLAAWGWARYPLMVYDRDLIARDKKHRLKEWDYYAVTSPDLYLEITLADISWAVMAAVSFIHYPSGRAGANLYFNLGPDPLLTLPADPYASTTFQRGAHFVSFDFNERTRILNFDFPASVVGPRIRGEIEVQDDPNEESLSTAFPFHEPDLFFYTDKIVALPACGEFDVGGRTYSFQPDRTYAVLDWGRGVWPSEFEWGWAVAGGMADGKRFGFNIGFGEEDNSKGTGNNIIYDGVLHKLGEIEWLQPQDNMEPWRFITPDGRFDMVMEPFHDQSGKLDFIIYSTDTTKVHGLISGRAVLDDGTVVVVDDIIGFAEHCYQKW